MIENFKIFVTNEAFSAFFLGFFLDLFEMSFNLVIRGGDFLDQRLGLL